MYSPEKVEHLVKPEDIGIPVTEIVKLPYFPQGVPCGNCKIVFEDILEYISVPKEFARGADFVVRANGDSMKDARIHDGDKLFVRNQKYLDNSGDIMILNALQDGCFCRKVFLDHENNQYILKSANPDFEDLVANPKEYEIIGKVIGVYIEV